MIDQLRYKQQIRQGQAIGSLSGQQIATYQGRYELTGQRVMRSADGSIDQVTYLSDSEPAHVPQYQPGRSIGIPGFINNK